MLHSNNGQLDLFAQNIKYLLQTSHSNKRTTRSIYTKHVASISDVINSNKGQLDLSTQNIIYSIQNMISSSESHTNKRTTRFLHTKHDIYFRYYTQVRDNTKYMIYSIQNMISISYNGKMNTMPNKGDEICNAKEAHYSNIIKTYI